MPDNAIKGLEGSSPIRICININRMRPILWNPSLCNIYNYRYSQVRNIVRTDIVIIMIVIHPIILDIFPLTLSLRIFLSLAIFIIVINIGTGTIPLIIAVYTNALMGSIFAKFIHSPIVDVTITA